MASSILSGFSLPMGIPTRKSSKPDPVVLYPTESGTPYEIQGVLGKGSQAEVFRVTTPKTHEYALKVYYPHKDMETAKKEAQMLEEVRESRHTLQMIKHFDLQRCFHDDKHRKINIDNRKGNVHAILMRLLPAPDTFTQYVEPLNPRELTRLSVKLIFCIGKQLLETLADLHQREIVHLDIKIENIAYNETTDELVVADFGLSKKIQELDPCELCGTSSYLAPEQLLGLPYDEKVDVWAAALVLFELYTTTSFNPVLTKNFTYRDISDLLHLTVKNKTEPLPPRSLQMMPVERKHRLFNSNGSFGYEPSANIVNALKELDAVGKTSPNVPLWQARILQAAKDKKESKLTARSLINFLRPMLRYKEDRISAAEALKNLAILEKAEAENCTERDSNP